MPGIVNVLKRSNAGTLERLLLPPPPPLRVERRRDRVGWVLGPGERVQESLELLLAPGFPLSHLRVRLGPQKQVTLIRYMIEKQGPTLRRSVPVLLKSVQEAHEAVWRLEELGLTSVFPVLFNSSEKDPRVLALLEASQISGLCEQPARKLRLVEDVPAFAGIRFESAHEFQEASEPEILESLDRRAYWNSTWSFTDDIPVSGLWRVRPNQLRDGVRGEFAAALAPAALERLGNPPYVVLVNPYFPHNCLPACVVSDERLEGEPTGNVVYIDRTVRETMGVSDGELCRVFPWHVKSRVERFRRWTYRKSVGPRTLVAHTKLPLKSDTEKPVCRMSGSSLAALGVPAGSFVTLEVLRPAGVGGTPTDWTPRRIRLRALEVEDSTMKARARWEGEQAPVYIDCAGRYAIFPPYPDVYLDFFTREALGKVPLCGVVQVRAAIPSRLVDEASDFAWLGFIAVVAALVAALGLSSLFYLAIALVVTLLLLFLRVRKAVR